MRFSGSGILRLTFVGVLALAGLSAGCISPKRNAETAVVPDTTVATQAQLIDEVNRFAKVGSMRAKVYLKFEDNSFAKFGNKEIYRQADGEVVVQRPAKIFLKVQIPVIKSDLVQMTSDGDKFRVAVLYDSYKSFVRGTNSADYRKLQRSLQTTEPENSTQQARENISALASMRPQHFTDALLVKPTDESKTYIESTIFQMDEDTTAEKKSPIRKVMRGYYLLDELARDGDKLRITRRFWFDRVGGIRLARQQIFDQEGEIDSDITYGSPGTLTATGEYTELPLRITVTRPKEKYAMTVTYQAPEKVTIGKQYDDGVFVLENSWGLREIDLDEKLRNGQSIQAENKPTPATTPAN